MPDDSASGSSSTLSRDDSLAVSSVDSCSSTSEDGGLRLGLGLSLGICEVSRPQRPCPEVEISVTDDFPGTRCSSSASSSKSGVNRISSASNPSSQVVGWPPLRTYRVNSVSKIRRSPSNKDLSSASGKVYTKVIALRSNRGFIDDGESDTKHGQLLKSSYVKVTMDGVPIGRKVNLTSHDSYEKLALTLKKMFFAPTAATDNVARSELQNPFGATRSLKLWDGSSCYVLTYEDKEGDWMLVGDVPWRMFLTSVRRLRIMRAAEGK